MNEQAPARRERVRRALAVCLVAALAMGVYGRVGDHPFISYDDPSLITGNERVGRGLSPGNVAWAFATLETGNWYPLTWLSHMLDVQLFGLRPGAHHLVSLGLHVADSALVLLLLVSATGALWRSALAAALFAVHPLQVESVAWAASRKEVLCALFWILGLAAYRRYAARPGALRMAAVAALLLLALMAKPMAATFPVLLLVLDYWPLGRLGRPGAAAAGGARAADLIREKVPLFAIALGAGLLAVTAQHAGGALATLERYPLVSRLDNALLSLATYLRSAFLPAGLAVFYPHRAGAVHPLPALAAAALVAGGSAILWRLRSRRPALLAGWAFFVCGLLPVLGILQTGDQAMADRYCYVPLLGLCVLAAWAVPRGLRPSPLRALAAAGWRQVGFWSDGETLYRRALAVTAGNYVAHANLGNLLARQGRLDEAADHYERALRIRPSLAEAHVGAGNVLLRRGDVPGALRRYRAALAAEPGSPEASANLGVTLAGLGRAREAVGPLRAAVRLLPENAAPLTALGVALQDTGATGEAEALYRRALAVRPGDIDARYNLALLLSRRGDLAGAEAGYRGVLALDPGHVRARNNLGVLLRGRGAAAGR